MAAQAGSLDDYHSAREPSDFKYESDELDLDPGPMDVEDEEEGGAFFSYSSTSSVARGYDTDCMERSNMANWEKKCLKQTQKENRTK